MPTTTDIHKVSRGRPGYGFLPEYTKGQNPAKRNLAFVSFGGLLPPCGVRQVNFFKGRDRLGLVMRNRTDAINIFNLVNLDNPDNLGPDFSLQTSNHGTIWGDMWGKKI